MCRQETAHSLTPSLTLIFQNYCESKSVQLIWLAVYFCVSGVVVTVQHCQSKAHLALATDASFYRGLDDLIADGLALTPGMFLPPQSMEADLSPQPRHVTDIVVLCSSL